MSLRGGRDARDDRLNPLRKKRCKGLHAWKERNGWTSEATVKKESITRKSARSTTSISEQQNATRRLRRSRCISLAAPNVRSWTPTNVRSSGTPSRASIRSRREGCNSCPPLSDARALDCVASTSSSVAVTVTGAVHTDGPMFLASTSKLIIHAKCKQRLNQMCLCGEGQKFFPSYCPAYRMLQYPTTCST